MANIRLKQLREQVVVITGASSGIGLCTAERAAERGAKAVLVARNERALETAVRRIRERGGSATSVVADVADRRAVEHAAGVAVREYGRIDTWINNAAVSIYGRLTDTPVDDMRRLFDVNFWGAVHGCNAAIPHLRAQGGALINVGSVESQRAVPLSGAYAASKHALKGYTDTLRMELEEAGDPISVTLVKPASIDTPLFEHARSYTGREPRPIPPVYDPEVVADAILACAQKPVRELYVGGAARMMATSEILAPRMTDRMMEARFFEIQQYAEPISADRPDNLYAPVPSSARVRGDYDGRVMTRSAYTTASLHPLLTTAAFAGVGLAAAAALRAGRRRADVGRPRPRGAVPDDRAMPRETRARGSLVSDAPVSSDQIGRDVSLHMPPADAGNALTRDNVDR